MSSRPMNILVTGGAKGIGLGVVQVLAAEGAIPVVVGRSGEDNEAAVRAVAEAGGRAWAVRAELTRTEECRQGLEAFFAKRPAPWAPAAE